MKIYLKFLSFYPKLCSISLSFLWICETMGRGRRKLCSPSSTIRFPIERSGFASFQVLYRGISAEKVPVSFTLLLTPFGHLMTSDFKETSPYSNSRETKTMFQKEHPLQRFLLYYIATQFGEYSRQMTLTDQSHCSLANEITSFSGRVKQKNTLGYWLCRVVPNDKNTV